MVSDRTGAGSTPRINGNGVEAPASAAALPDARYDFLDEREPDFKWQPVDGSARSGEPTLPERAGIGLRRPMVIVAGLAVAVALAAGGALLLKGAKPVSAPPAASPPAGDAAERPAPAAAPAPAQPPAPASEPVKDATSPAAETGGGTVLEKPATPPPPGGEDGPPAPAGMR